MPVQRHGSLCGKVRTGHRSGAEIRGADPAVLVLSVDFIAGSSGRTVAVLGDLESSVLSVRSGMPD
jgi:hypothetical protein